MMRLALVVGGIAGIAASAYADSAYPDNVPGISATAPGLTPEGVLAPISVVEGPGIKIGEGTVIHPIVGLETGFISNVFYESSAEAPRGAGITRLVAQVGVGTLSPQRLTAAAPDADTSGSPSIGVLEYRADLRASYDFYLSGDSNVRAQDGLGVGAMLRGVLFPRRTWSFLFLDDFQRLIRPTNFESTVNTNRDINRLQLGLSFAPVGRSMMGLLHYENVLDIFETENQRFADRMQHSVGLTWSWRFRPVTVLFADVTQGFYGGFGSASTKVDSYPLLAVAGVQTLLSINTTLVGRIGYSNGFYSSGPNYSAVVGGVQLGYRYAHTGRVTALYDYAHQDSINANFYRDHTFRLLLEQQFVPFIMTIQPEARLRHYNGVDAIISNSAVTRDDVILTLAVGMRYNFRDTIAAVAEYRLISDKTDYMTPAGDDPSYLRHELVAGVRAAL